MVKTYDSSQHLALVFAWDGTVWSSCIIQCLLNTLFFSLLWGLRENRGFEVDLGEDQEYALSLLVSFLIVSTVEINIKRFEASGKNLYSFRNHCKVFVTRIAIHGAGPLGAHAYSGGSKFWREKVRLALKNFITVSLDLIRDGEKCRSYMLDGKFENLNENIATEIQMTMTEETYGPWEHLRYLTHCVSLQSKILEEPMPIQTEMVFYNLINQLQDDIELLCNTIQTPMPFPIVNLTKISLFTWIIIIPFIQEQFTPINLIVVFFLTYSVVGLDSVADEISDPFGDDTNDFDVETIRDSIINHIDRVLSPTFHCYFDGEDREKVDLKYEELRGWKHLAKENYDGALFDFKSALDKSTATLSEKSYFLEILGDVYAIKSMCNEANLHYVKAIESLKVINKKLTDVVPALRVGRKLSDSLFDSRRYDESLKRYQKVLSWCSTDSKESLLASPYLRHRIGLILYLKGEYESSITEFSKALQLQKNLMQTKLMSYNMFLNYAEGGEIVFISTVMFCMGLVHEARQEFEWARSQFTESLAIQIRYEKQFRLSDMFVSTLAHLALANSQIGDKHESNVALFSARRISAMESTSDGKYSGNNSKENSETIIAKFGHRNVLDLNSSWEATKEIIRACS